MARPHTTTLIGSILPAFLIIAYAFWPGDPSGVLPGWPWQARGGAVMVLVVMSVLLKWAYPSQGQRGAWIYAVLLPAVVGRIFLSSVLIPEGWSSAFFVLRAGTPEVAERIGRRASDGGVIDRTIELSERSAALQFLNEHDTAPGGPDPTRPVVFEARWRGYVLSERDARVLLRIANGATTQVLVDGEAVATPAATPIRLTAGPHQITVAYRKLAGESPRISAVLTDESGAAVPVYADPPTPGQLRNARWARNGLRVLDLLVICVAMAWVWPSSRTMAAAGRRRMPLADVARSRALLVSIPLAAFALHGLIAASLHSDLTVFLIGDDMRGYAADGRDIVLRGLLMNDGGPLFAGEPFYFYPLYPYFVALTHVLFDESFYGLVLMQFLLLGATMALIVWLTLQMFGHRVAWVALVILCVLAEINFARYYTVSVFTDNLYYPLVAGAVAAMWRMDATRSWHAAVVAGVLGGLATLTRPSMMPVLPFVAGWLLWNRAGRTLTNNRTAALVFSASWMATIGLATFRNWLVSGRFVLLAESSLQILFYLAPPGVNYSLYMTSPRPSVPETLMSAVDMFGDYPLAILLVQARKLAFMVGVTNVVPGYRMHPEFLALSAGYLGWWLLARQRSGNGAVVHFTLLGHVIAFLAASPMTYGYKTILTLMMLVAPFTAAFLWTVVRRIRGGEDTPAYDRSALTPVSRTIIADAGSRASAPQQASAEPGA